MPEAQLLKYPRKRIIRGIYRFLGKTILPLAFRIKVEGQDNFPAEGPLIVVGNHIAVMEAVFMAIFTPWQVETLGAADIPHEKITAFFANSFGHIPVNRGHMDRQALRQAINILNQKGIIGMFPEGGIWEPGAMRAQTGVSWISYRANAPVLPIGFGGTLGALSNAIKLKRPRISIHVGELIPPAHISPGKNRKTYFQNYASKVMDAVNALLPPDNPTHTSGFTNESFELKVTIYDQKGEIQACPTSLLIQHDLALAKVLHRPTILKIFRKNLQLPMKAIQNLDKEHPPRTIVESVQSILDYIDKENPFLLTYRFGPKEGEAMVAGFREMLAMAQWADLNAYRLEIEPIRRFYSIELEKEVIQKKQGRFEGWM